MLETQIILQFFYIVLMWRGPHSLLKTIIEGYFYCYLSKHETQAMYRLIINKLLF